MSKLHGYFWFDPPGPPPTLSLNKYGFAVASHFFPSFKPQQWLLGRKQRDQSNKKTTIVTVLLRHDPANINLFCVSGKKQEQATGPKNLEVASAYGQSVTFWFRNMIFPKKQKKGDPCLKWV